MAHHISDGGPEASLNASPMLFRGIVGGLGPRGSRDVQVLQDDARRLFHVDDAPDAPTDDFGRR
jgi:hypothetical protein